MFSFSQFLIIISFFQLAINYELESKLIDSFKPDDEFGSNDTPSEGGASTERPSNSGPNKPISIANQLPSTMVNVIGKRSLTINGQNQRNFLTKLEKQQRHLTKFSKRQTAIPIIINIDQTFNNNTFVKPPNFNESLIF